MQSALSKRESIPRKKEVTISELVLLPQISQLGVTDNWERSWENRKGGESAKEARAEHSATAFCLRAVGPGFLLIFLSFFILF